jgi:hypothetical protein
MAEVALSVLAVKTKCHPEQSEGSNAKSIAIIDPLDLSLCSR